MQFVVHFHRANFEKKRHSSVGTATRLRARHQKHRGAIPGRGATLALEPTQPTIQ